MSVIKLPGGVETPSPDARGVLLYALAVVVKAHQHDPERCGKEAVRSLQVARMGWHDVFGPVAAAEPCLREAADLAGARAVHAAVLARSVERVLFLATPAQLAILAVALCRPDWTAPPGDVDRDLERAGMLLDRLHWQAFQDSLQPCLPMSAAQGA